MAEKRPKGYSTKTPTNWQVTSTQNSLKQKKKKKRRRKRGSTRLCTGKNNFGEPRRKRGMKKKHENVSDRGWGEGAREVRTKSHSTVRTTRKRGVL